MEEGAEEVEVAAVDRELQLTSDLRQMWNLKVCHEMAKPKTVE
jgi:hypothetical protein